MPNIIWFKEDSPAARFYRTLDPSRRSELDRILDNLRNDYTPDGVQRTTVFMAPAFVSYYYDGHIRVAYHVAWSPDKDCCNIEILTIAIS